MHRVLDSADLEDGLVTSEIVGGMTRRDALYATVAPPILAREFLRTLMRTATGAAVFALEQLAEAADRPDMAVILDEVQTSPDEPKYLDIRYVQAILGDAYEYLGKRARRYHFRVDGEEVILSAQQVQARAQNPSYTINIPGVREVNVQIDLHDFANQLPGFAAEFRRQREGIPQKQAGIAVERPGERKSSEIRVMDISKFLNPNDPLVQKLAAEITAGIQEPIEKLRALLIFVQQFKSADDPTDVVGTNKFDRPAFPHAVLLLRQGECEDKIGLLASLALAVPEVTELGLELVYGWNPPSNQFHIMFGVHRGVQEIAHPDYGMPRKTAGVYVLDAMNEAPGLIGYLPGSMSERDIKHRTRLT